MVRNAIAAVLASAAAALLYRSANKADDRDERDRGGDAENDRYDARPSEQSVVRKAQRKAAAAADTVSKSAKKAAKKLGKKSAVRTSNAAAAPVQTSEPTADKPKRKPRSDAGVKRGPKAAAPSESPEVLDLTVFSDTEARSAVLSSDTAPEPEAAQVPAEEQVAEAHPS